MQKKVTVEMYLSVSEDDLANGKIRREVHQFAATDIAELLNDMHGMDTMVLCEPNIKIEDVPPTK